MTTTTEERKHFAREAIRKITDFLKNHPEYERTYIGIRRAGDGDYIWMREWNEIEHTKPTCTTCGQEMFNGTLANPDKEITNDNPAPALGYPYWFCDSKRCRDELRARYQQELEEYRNGEGKNNELTEIFKAINIPSSYYGKTLANLQMKDKNSTITDMKNKLNLLIIGASGTGKTHLACALLIDFGRYKSHKFRFESIPKLFVQIQKCINNNEDYTQIIDDALSYDTLVLDDLGAVKTSDYRKEVLYNIISGRGFENKHTIITTNMSLDHIEAEFDERLASRLSEYKEIHMHGKDYRQIRGISS